MTEGISIIIITMNRAKELTKTIELLKQQKCSYPYEILIIDQASTDETQTMFSHLKSPFLYFRFDKNFGVSGGRNRGAKLAHYSYMVFLDDDAHFLDDHALEKIYERMKKSDYNLFAFKILNNDGDLYNWPYNNRLLKKSDDEFVAGTFIGCGHAIKKPFFNIVKGYSDVLFFWGEESELVMKSIGYDGKAVQYIGAIRIVHRVKGNGRNTYDAKRFYYQVRNRLYLYSELVPRIAFCYKYYYLMGYWYKAKKNGWMKEYRKGILDHKKMSVEYDKKLKISEFIKYEKIVLKG